MKHVRLMAVCSVFAAASSAHAQITWRGDSGQAGRNDLEPIAVTPVGVVARAPGGDAASRRLISWDLVRSVRGASVPDADKFLQAADDAWRARTRLERGDWPAAEPLLENLHEALSGEPGPTTQLVAEGLLRCRLARGARVGAIWPWLVAARCAEVRAESEAVGPSWIGGSPDLPAVVDAATGLVPSLPPMWIAGAAIESASASEEWAAAGAPGTQAATLASLYLASMRIDSGQPVVLTDGASESDGVRFVHSILAARVGGAAEREAARQALKARRASSASDWVVAWCTAAIGRSLVRESDARAVGEGVMELLRVPAAFGDSQAYLSGIALMDAAVALDRSGRTAEARSVAHEIALVAPDHPAIESEDIRRLLSGAGASPEPTPR